MVILNIGWKVNNNSGKYKKRREEKRRVRGLIKKDRTWGILKMLIKILTCIWPVSPVFFLCSLHF